MIVRCDCGADHDVIEPVAKLITELGTHIRVTTHGRTVARGVVTTEVVPGATWLVPRVWIAVHGLKAWELERLAERHGWERVVP